MAAVALTACGGAQAGTPPVPATQMEPEPAPVAQPPPAPPAPLAFRGLIAAEPADDAPAELAQFGRMVGVWSCTSEQIQQDGTFAPGTTTATWTWFYTLGGRAVQDIWETGASVGTNLRVYDPETDSWEIQWVASSLVHFQLITARAVGDTVVMHGEAPAGGGFPAHARRITFFDITDDRFEWKYEATKSGTDTGWSEFSRLHCTKVNADPLDRAG